MYERHQRMGRNCGAPLARARAVGGIFDCDLWVECASLRD